MSTSALTTTRHALETDLQPLVVDLDGSLVRGDTLLECFVVALRHPIKLARAVVALRRGKAALKAAPGKPSYRRGPPSQTRTWPLT